MQKNGNTNTPLGLTNSEEMDESLSEQEQNIAELICYLANCKEVPQKLKAPTIAIKPEEINFKDSSWINNLYDIKAWINLNEVLPLRISENAVEAAEEFFSSLEINNSKECYIQAKNGCIQPTKVGLFQIESRLEIAEECCKFYLEKLEEGLNKNDAKKQWENRWDEFNINTLEEPAQPINAQSTTTHIRQIADLATGNRLDLTPSYQRGDVWSNSDAQKLIESILLGIPMPSIILLEKRGKTGSYSEVVDGKQRITAILRFIGKHPKAREKIRKAEEELKEQGQKNIDLLHLFETDYPSFLKRWKALKNEVIREKDAKDYFFPFKLRIQNSKENPLNAIDGKYYTEIVNDILNTVEGPARIKEFFEEDVIYKIPIIKYIGSTPAQIHRVFNLYNRQGKHLNAEEIRNAVFHEVDLLRLLHALSGDGEDINALTPWLNSDSSRKKYPATISSTLNGYAFGVSRYKRTKILAWLVATALHSSLSVNGEDLAVRSTAKQIDEFLATILKSDDSKLKNKKVLQNLADDLSKTLELHSSLSSECFPDDFKGSTTGKWDELQLIGSLLGFFFVTIASENAAILLDEKVEDIYKFIKDIKRPTNAQNKSQWIFLSKVALGILKTCEISQEFADAALRTKYGVSSISNTLNRYALLK